MCLKIRKPLMGHQSMVNHWWDNRKMSNHWWDMPKPLFAVPTNGFQNVVLQATE
jgi:hypothetical protein